MPPPAPPIQPAPPGGARREAKQRQAAAAKSEEGGEGGVSEAREQGGDLVSGESQEGTYAMRRRQRERAAPSFTTVSARRQPSAWAQGALYGGGLTLSAVLLALGWSIGRPRSRRRPPVVPVPARSHAPQRHRA